MLKKIFKLGSSVATEEAKSVYKETKNIFRFWLYGFSIIIVLIIIGLFTGIVKLIAG